MMFTRNSTLSTPLNIAAEFSHSRGFVIRFDSIKSLLSNLNAEIYFVLISTTTIQFSAAFFGIGTQPGSLKFGKFAFDECKNLFCEKNLRNFSNFY